MPKPDDDVDMGMDFIDHMLPKDARVSEEPVNLDGCTAALQRAQSSDHVHW